MAELKHLKAWLASVRSSTVPERVQPKKPKKKPLPRFPKRLGRGRVKKKSRNPFGRPAKKPTAEDHELFPTLDRVEALYISSVLEHCEGNRMKAHRLLGISYATLLRRIMEYGLADVGRDTST